MLRFSLGFSPIEPGSCVAAFDPVRREKRRTTKHAGAGEPTTVTIMRFSAWAHEQHHFPTPQQVMDRFGCNRATAYRWLSALAEAHGLERVPNRSAA